MAKSFEDLIKRTCSKDVIIDGYRRTMNYLSEYVGMPDLFKSNDIVLPDGFSPKKLSKIFKPYSITTKTVSHYSPPKRRDVSRRWK
jgi:hypothetical protein